MYLFNIIKKTDNYNLRHLPSVFRLLPVGLFMLYVHHRVRKHIDLAKWFHL